MGSPLAGLPAASAPLVVPAVGAGGAAGAHAALTRTMAPTTVATRWYTQMLGDRIAYLPESRCRLMLGRNLPLVNARLRTIGPARPTRTGPARPGRATPSRCAAPAA